MTRLAPNSRNRYSTLKCPNKYCNNVSSPIFLVEGQILQFLRNWLATYELNRKTIPVVSMFQEIENKQAIITKIESEIAGLQAQLDRAYDFLEQGIYTVDVFQQRSALLNKNIEQLKDSLDLVRKEINRMEQLRLERELYAPKVRNLLESYQTNSAASNNQILKEVIDKVTYIKETPNRRGGLYNANFSLEIFPKVPG